MEKKVTCDCSCSGNNPEPVQQETPKENWYLPYMDKKTKGIEVEEKKNPVAVFYCAGASNVGQSTMLASVQAANRVGYDKAALLCLASISAGLKNIHNGAKNAKGIVVVDGCPMQCALKTLQKAEFAPQKSFVLTKDFEIKKNFDLNSREDVEKIASGVAQGILEVYTSSKAE